MLWGFKDEEELWVGRRKGTLDLLLPEFPAPCSAQLVCSWVAESFATSWISRTLSVSLEGAAGGQEGRPGGREGRKPIGLSPLEKCGEAPLSGALFRNCCQLLWTSLSAKVICIRACLGTHSLVPGESQVSPS